MGRKRNLVKAVFKRRDYCLCLNGCNTSGFTEINYRVAVVKNQVKVTVLSVYATTDDGQRTNMTDWVRQALFTNAVCLMKEEMVYRVQQYLPHQKIQCKVAWRKRKT